MLARKSPVCAVGLFALRVVQRQQRPLNCGVRITVPECFRRGRDGMARSTPWDRPIEFCGSGLRVRPQAVKLWPAAAGYRAGRHDRAAEPWIWSI